MVLFLLSPSRSNWSPSPLDFVFKTHLELSTSPNSFILTWVQTTVFSNLNHCRSPFYSCYPHDVLPTKRSERSVRKGKQNKVTLLVKTLCQPPLSLEKRIKPSDFFPYFAKPCDLPLPPPRLFASLRASSIFQPCQPS